MSVPIKPLHLANLSQLYRITSFARALRLSIHDLLSLKALTGLDPFVRDMNPVTPVHMANTLWFVERLRKVRASGFSIAELDYLLRYRFDDKKGIAPAEEDIAQILHDIRDGLQKIAADTALTPDPNDELTRKQLASLKWDNMLIEDVIATLSDAKVYETTLPLLPGNLNFPKDLPDELKNKVSYDSKTQKLRFVGVMTLTEQGTLLGLDYSNTSDDVTAITALFNDPRTFISERMKAYCQWPIILAQFWPIKLTHLTRFNCRFSVSVDSAHLPA